MNENEIGDIIIPTALNIHRDLGPGLLESVYEVILFDELRKAGLSVRCQIPVPITYKGRHFQEAFRADLVVENRVLIELKSVEAMNKAHQKQLFTYLKLMSIRLGYLLNFGAPLMRDGISRVVNGLDDPKLGIFGPSSTPKR
jgi:GxxExxY protein